MVTLYKKDSSNKIRILNLWAEGAIFKRESGIIDGKLVPESTLCKGKNIGKSNETTPEEQAISDMNSKITEKLKKGEYFKTKKEAEESGEVILPMLAQDYKKFSKKIDWKKDVFVQPKFDGMRCFAIVKNGEVKLISRENTDIIVQHSGSMNHLLPELGKLADGIYDGELYAHGYTFQENMKLIKKYRKGESENVKLYCYDFVSPLTYWKRRNYIIIANKITDAIQLVETQSILGEKDLNVYHSKFLEEGYEGTIIRHSDEGYELNKRSYNLLKYKDFIDIALKIVDVIPMEARPKQGKVVCEMPDGRTFPANLKFSHAVREEMLLNKEDYIGQTGEIRFFEYTDSGLPRFPVCVGFRLDK